MALSSTRSAIASCAALGALVLFVYRDLPLHDFVAYDDDLYIRSNPQIAAGLGADSLRWALTTREGANWFPLTRISWLLDRELQGPGPAGFHRSDLALHLGATLLLFAALRRMTRATARSALVAAIFAVHPLHVESVAWASARKDTLSGCFFALALWLHAGALRPRARRILSTSLAMLAGSLAKPMLVSLPCVLLLLDLWPLRRLHDDDDRFAADRLRAALLEKLPLFALSALIAWIAFHSQQAAGALADAQSLPLSSRIANAPLAIAAYLRQAFWPSGLSVFYPHPQPALGDAAVLASALLLAALGAAAWRLRRRAPALIVGYAWFLGMLVPVLGLVQVGSQARADRYTYLPLIGVALALVWGLPACVGTLARSARARRAGFALAVGAVLALALVARQRLADWRDTGTLMRAALEVDPDNPVAHTYLGVHLLAGGDTEQALAHWKQAAQLRPGDAVLANNLAWLLVSAEPVHLRDPQAAIRLAEAALRLRPEDPSILDTLATAQAAAGRFDEARRSAGRALALAEAGGDAELARSLRRELERYARETPTEAE